MFEEQDNNTPAGSLVAPVKPVTPVTPVMPVTPANLPTVEPEDVLATIDPTKAAPSRPLRSTSAMNPGIPEEYLDSSSGLGKRIALAAVILVIIVAIAGAVYWYVAVRDATPVTTPVTNTESGEVVPTPDLQPQGESPKDLNDDSDADGLSLANEQAAGTDSNNPDTDGDGLFDGEEVRIYGTNPLNADTDGDTFSDADEVRNGFNPKGEGRLFNVPQQ